MVRMEKIKRMTIITDFQHYTPRHQYSQARFQARLLEILNEMAPNHDVNWAELIKKYTVSPSKINQRYLEFIDVLFNTDNTTDFNPNDKCLAARMEQYELTVDKIFKNFYQDCANIPDDIIHVSCTDIFHPVRRKNMCLKTVGQHM